MLDRPVPSKIDLLDRLDVALGAEPRSSAAARRSHNEAFESITEKFESGNFGGGAVTSFRTETTNINREIIYGGGADSVANSVMWSRLLVSGRIDAVEPNFYMVGPHRLRVSDVLSTAEPFAAQGIHYVVGANGSVVTEAQRNGQLIYMVVSGQVGSPSAPKPYMPFVGQQIELSIQGSQGGTGGWDGIVAPGVPWFRGSVFGGNDLLVLRPGSDYYSDVIARECTLAVREGVAPPHRKIGLHISMKDPEDAVQAMGDAIALCIAGAGLVPWKTGIGLGWQSGTSNWPFDANSVLIGIIPQKWPNAIARSGRNAKLGLDLSEGTFAEGPIKAYGFLLTDGGKTLHGLDTGNKAFVSGAPSNGPVVFGADFSSAATDVTAVVLPKGAGALAASIPDNTAIGGNVRGDSAVDWQTTRTTAAQAATAANSVISGGQSNQASAANAVVAGGNTNQASGNSSWVPGGAGATTRARFGTGAWAAGSFAVQGDAQAGEGILRRQSTSATARRLTADDQSAGANNSFTLPNNGTFLVRAMVTARQVPGGSAGTVGDSAGWDVVFLMTRGAAAADTVLVGGGGASIAPTLNSAGAAAWRLSITADTTFGAINITGTGEANKTIDWVARIISVETVG